MTGIIEIYGYWRSVATYRVRVALALKGLGWVEHPVDLLAGDQFGRDFAGLNPQSVVPVLVVDGHALTQSLAIIEYLEERYPTPALLPGDRFLRAEVRSFAMIAIADAHPLQVPRVRKSLAGEFGAEAAGIAKWCGHWQSLALRSMEKRIASYREMGGFCFGAEPTLADIALCGQVFTAQGLGIGCSEFPVVDAVFRRCQALEAFSKHSPEALNPAHAGRGG